MTNTDTITQLNALLKGKLTGINQYFLHARMLKHKGNLKLADHEYKTSIDAMKHADMLVEHILTLGGMPHMNELGSLNIGKDETSMLAGDLEHAQATLAQFETALSHCKSCKDEATAALLSRIMDSQREQIDYIRNQMNPPKSKECA